MRARKKHWATKEIETNNYIITSPENNKGKWHEYFGNNNPIYIEIGCGKGTFITTNAQINPNINYIGIEKEDQVLVMALKNARETGANRNLCFFSEDAKNLEDYFDVNEINRVYINFCDPWHRKKKWAKRRLTHRDFLNKYNIIMEKSEVFFKTDNKVLFEFSLNEFCELDWKLKNISLDLHNSDFSANIMTEYEKKFSEMGLPIYRLEAYKN